MRKWLLLLVLILVFFILSKLNRGRGKTKNPVLKQINYVVTVIAWVFLIAYGLAFFYWIFTVIKP